MADVVSEVMEDGGTEVTETAHASNYEVSLGRLDGAVPEPPPLDAISKLFKPRYTLNITTDDGTVIQFVYKRSDPATLMITHGSPIAIGAEDAEDAVEVSRKFADLQEREDAAGGVLPDDAQEELNELMSDPRTQELFALMDRRQKATVQTNVISPVITDEIYDALQPEILRALYEAITGGITSQNELVEYFRERAEE